MQVSVDGTCQVVCSMMSCKPPGLDYTALEMKARTSTALALCSASWPPLRSSSLLAGFIPSCLPFLLRPRKNRHHPTGWRSPSETGRRSNIIAWIFAYPKQTSSFMTDCNCFSSALQVSDQLHRTEHSLASASLDQVLNASRFASSLCRQYAACPSCTDPSYFAIYVLVLRTAVRCYNYLAHASSNNPSPSSVSTSSSASSQSYRATSRVRIGAFEVEAPLDDRTRAAVLRNELSRAAEAAQQLNTVLGPSSPKASTQYRDHTTLEYQRGLVRALREEIAAVEQILLAG